jgi:hypothetical protein
MTTIGLPEGGITCASVQLVDQVHPAGSIMPQEVFCSSLLQSVHAFPDGLLPIHVCFLWSMGTILRNFDG